ncbi:HAD hydrolase-like protein [Actinomycetota bacterium]|nr:HAD hydrolase-like protein [Actinomycetota bacterium]
MIRLSKPDSSIRVILWDIDGTLVKSSKSRADKHVRAAEIFLGCSPLKQERTAGKTDRQILHDLLEEQGSNPSSGALVEAMCILDELTQKEISDYSIECNPGVGTALRLLNRAGWINGLLTGNTPIRAQLKLDAAGVYRAFDLNFAYFGDQACDRDNLAAAGASGIKSSGCHQAVVIGDTPLDIQSAQANKLKVVAVATGSYHTEELMEYEPDLLIRNLESDLGELTEYLTSLT